MTGAANNARDRGATGEAGAYARSWSKGGIITVIAFHHDGRKIARTYNHDEADVGVNDFAEVHQEQGANIYYRQSEHGPIEKKPAKSDVGLRGVFGSISTREKSKKLSPAA